MAHKKSAARQQVRRLQRSSLRVSRAGQVVNERVASSAPLALPTMYDPTTIAPRQMLQMQRAIGNRAVGHVLQARLQAAAPPGLIQRDVTLKQDTKPGVKEKFKDVVITTDDAIERIVSSVNGKSLVAEHGRDAVEAVFKEQFDGKVYKDFNALLRPLVKHFSAISETRTKRRDFVRNTEAQLKSGEPITERGLAQYIADSGSNDGDQFYIKMAKKLREMVGKRDATAEEVQAAFKEVSATKVGQQLLDKGTPISPRSPQATDFIRNMFRKKLPNILKHKDGLQVLEKLVAEPHTQEMSDLLMAIARALITLDRSWGAIKPAGQDKICEVVTKITEMGTAKGAYGELSAAVYALGKASKQINVGHEKEKYPGGKPLEKEKEEEEAGEEKKGEERATQDVDVSYTGQGQWGGAERFYIEAKYDMRTFLDKADTTIEVQGKKVPKQLHMYEVVQNRQKAAADQGAEPVKPKRVELFISKPHDWLLLFLPEYRKYVRYLIDHNWRVVVGTTELSKSFMEQLYAEVRPIALKLNEDRQAQQRWAKQLSAQHAPDASFLAVLAELAKAPDIRPPTGPLPNPWLNQPAATVPWEVEMALNNANRPLDDMMEVHINAAVRTLASDTSKLKTLLFGLQYKNPLLLAWLRRRYSKKSDDSLFQSVLPVLDNVIREFAQNRPRFEDF